MSRLIRLVALVAAMSTSAAVVPATPEAPVRDPVSGSKAAPARGATEITPAEPPARPSMLPGGPAAVILPGAILLGIGAAIATGGGDEPAPFPTTGTTGTR